MNGVKFDSSLQLSLSGYCMYILKGSKYIPKATATGNFPAVGRLWVGDTSC